MKKLIPILFVLGFILVAVAITLMDKGLWKQTTLFVGFVSAIAAMIMRIALMTKN